MFLMQSLSQNKLAAKAALLALGTAMVLASTPAAQGQTAKLGDRAKAAQQTQILEQKVRAGASSSQSSYEVSCHPGRYRPGVCPNALIQACDKYGGGMSHNPDGSSTCTLY